MFHAFVATFCDAPPEPLDEVMARLVADPEAGRAVLEAVLRAANAVPSRDP